MIGRLQDMLAGIASRYLTKRRIRKERELIHRVAQQMRIANGQPPHKALGG